MDRNISWLGILSNEFSSSDKSANEALLVSSEQDEQRGSCPDPRLNRLKGPENAGSGKSRLIKTQKPQKWKCLRRNAPSNARAGIRGKSFEKADESRCRTPSNKSIEGE